MNGMEWEEQKGPDRKVLSGGGTSLIARAIAALRPCGDGRE